MGISEGKEFEGLFKRLTEEAGYNCIRLHDTLYKYKDVENPCDFIISRGADSPSILIECKTCKGTSFSVSKFKQLERLEKLPLFKSYVVIWFVEYKKVLAIPTQEILRILEEGRRSINPTKMENIWLKALDLAEFNRTRPSKLNLEGLWENP